MNRIIAAILAALSLVIAVVFLAWAIESFWRTNGWSETTGTVIDADSDDTTVGFVDSDGIEYTFRSDYGGSDTREGDQVTKYRIRSCTM